MTDQTTMVAQIQTVYEHLKQFIENADHEQSLSYTVLSPVISNSEFDYNTKTMLLSMRLRDLRHSYISNFSYVLITDKFITDLVTYLKPMCTVELGAGSGYLANQLRLGGVDITAVDDHSWWNKWDLTSHSIVTAKQEDFDLSDYQAVIMSWPNYESDTAWRVLNNLNHDQVLIYIGEGWGGCTADDKFHQILEDEFTQLTLESEMLNKHMLSFSGIHDSVYVYRRLPDAVALIAGE